MTKDEQLKQSIYNYLKSQGGLVCSPNLIASQFAEEQREKVKKLIPEMVEESQGSIGFYEAGNTFYFFYNKSREKHNDSR